MQPAYAQRVAKAAYQGPRFQRRVYWLQQLVREHGGPKIVGEALGTPASHITAMTKGNRGVGDELADRLERVYHLDNGWLDQPMPGDRVSRAAPSGEDARVLPGGAAQPIQFPATNQSMRHAAQHIARLLTPLNTGERELASVALKNLALSPETADKFVDSLANLLGEEEDDISQLVRRTK